MLKALIDSMIVWRPSGDEDTRVGMHGCVSNHLDCGKAPEERFAKLEDQLLVGECSILEVRGARIQATQGHLDWLRSIRCDE
jgi:hypothetical protein